MRTCGTWPRVIARRLLISAVSVVLLTACGAAPGDDGASDEPTSAEPLGVTPPVILVPTSTAEKVVAATCAAELDATYCSATSAAAAAAKCNERLGPNRAWLCGGACLVTYDAHRATCHAGPTYPTPAACSSPVVDDCSFYRACMEASRPCGDKGYALDYGERLCYAFVEKRDRFTPAGQAWLRGIRTCLQTAMVPALDDGLTCDGLTDAAFAAHAPCYVAPGNSFCKLPVSDALAVARIVGSALLSSRSLTQIRQVATHCALESIGFKTSATSMDGETAPTQRIAGAEPGVPGVPAAVPASRAFFQDLARAAEDPETFQAFLDASPQ